METLSLSKISLFQKFIWNFYQEQGRSFAWRDHQDPYAIVVSEIMLQQTQTYRVAQKFDLWMQEFKDFKTLSEAPLRDVLSVWQGLGYNRRALALQKIAQKVVDEYDGVLPDDPQILITFPSIGPNTAASICAFAFNAPTVFIETNIRAVFIESFFSDKNEVSDKEIFPLVAQAVDLNNPRHWYYALMDYGVFLKARLKNPCIKSTHYAKQSKFEGSHRQIRGMILKIMAQHDLLAQEMLFSYIQKDKIKVEKALLELYQEGFIKNENGKISIV
jgi:A/G-specific adenine glycosylase